MELEKIERFTLNENEIKEAIKELLNKKFSGTVKISTSDIMIFHDEKNRYTAEFTVTSKNKNSN
jgi:hypothetical protein